MRNVKSGSFLKVMWWADEVSAWAETAGCGSLSEVDEFDACKCDACDENG